MAGISTHYLPRFMLERFRLPDNSLYQLDKESGQIDPCSVKRAGQDTDFYPPEIENGVLRTIDDSAARIFRRTLFDENWKSDTFTPDEKETIAEWLVMFLVRTPSNLKRCEYISKISTDKDMLESLNRNFGDVANDMLRRHPELTAQDVPQIYDALRTRIEGKKFPLSGRGGFEHMHHTDSHKKYAKLLVQRKWIFIRSEVDFIIGDLPLVLWDKQLKTVRDGGLMMAMVELTVPITRNITLKMLAAGSAEKNMPIDWKKTRDLNRRQIDAAVRYVYGPTREAVSNQLKK